ncbi:hypothetical protein Cri9333_2846 [Crinalium epipsammum PCC 9333]|uniref:Uncharacterized protein n=1 Tax=Crinalium epipsammum PCC 9333 TaxID=1173022 RepID=K9W2N8_9CYAN|nr:hypothetical protein [Crinalium epipsammum]AFZ13690.1 hypothetical protein Cri9333_2846 [Crinalium epipsammum PCC 9333]
MVKTFSPGRHQRFTLASLKLLMAKHPVAFCGGIWIFLVLVSTVAAQGLLSPSFVKQQHLKSITADNVEQGASKSIHNSAVEQKQSSKIPAAIQEENLQNTPSSTNVEVQNFSPVTIAKSQQNHTLLWLYGGIFVTFILGFLFICISFRYKPQRSQKIKSGSKKLKSNQNQTKRKSKEQLPKQQRKQPSQQLRKPIRAKSPHGLQPLVTVMPPEPNFVVDSGEESLADIMDMRKHQSLAELLGEKKIS